jgi:Zn-dependent alcohol dehydrogenase
MVRGVLVVPADRHSVAPPAVADAVIASRKGGTIVVTGLARIDGVASLPMFSFVMQEKRLIGSAYGSGQPARDIPRLAGLYLEGKLKLREFVTRTYSLHEINDAPAALARADGARGVIAFQPER